MLIYLSVILFIFSVMGGALTRTAANPSIVDHLVNTFCGLLSVVTGFLFSALVMFLWSDGAFKLHGYPEHAGLMVAGCVPGFLGLFASTWYHKSKARKNAAQSQAGA